MVQRVLVVLASLVLAAASRAQFTTVSELARLEGAGETVLQGLGLVVGLAGTGDSGKEMPAARPMVEAMRRLGNPIGTYEEVKNARSVALVMVMCRIPEGGARADDAITVTVSAYHSASSLAGGILYLAPLYGPYGIGDEPYAIAQGKVEIESTSVPTQGIVHGGARLIQDVGTADVKGESFMLVLRPHYRGWGAATHVARSITDEIYGRPEHRLGSLPTVATVLDDRRIRVDIPPQERAAGAQFIADVLAAPVDPSLLKLTPMVICNRRTGAIVMTGDVQISPVVVTHADLSITVSEPPIPATLENPSVTTSRSIGIQTRARESERARLADLLAAFTQLRVPAEKQIDILKMISDLGKLHAKLVIE